MPLVSVVIPTYDRAHCLEKAIRSVLSQTIADLEVLVCDDGSTDGSRFAVERIAKEDDRVAWVSGEHSGLPAVPRNHGLAVSKGEWIAFIDSDDQWYPSKLEKQMALLSETGLRACCCNAYLKKTMNDSIWVQLYYGKQVATFSDLCESSPIITGSVLFHRSMLHTVVGFPETPLLRGCSEDYALWLRIAAQAPFAFLNEPLLEYADDSPDSIRLERRWSIPTYMVAVWQDFLHWADSHRTLVIDKDYRLAVSCYRKNRRIVRKQKALDALRAVRGRVISTLVASGFAPRIIHGAGVTDRSKREHLTRVLNIAVRNDAIDSKAQGLSCIIFTKDRAMQLDALLRSMAAQCQPFPIVSILLMASSAEHHAAYEEVLLSHRSLGLRCRQEVDFRNDLLSILRTINSRRVFFLVDDIVFTRPCDFAVLDRLDYSQCVVSLRLGGNLSYCGIKDRFQPVPDLHPVAGEAQLRWWVWKNGHYDWGYPLSVDGNVFLTKQILAMAESLNFHSPNSLELQMQLVRGYFAEKKGVCFEKSLIVNVPCNRVQNEVKNPCGRIGAEDLLARWRAGYRISVENFYGLVNKSVHEQVELMFVQR